MIAHEQLDDWLREGRPEPMTAKLAAHVQACVQCREALHEMNEVRGWFDEEPEALDADAADAIRFRLQAETRKAETRKADTHQMEAASTSRSRLRPLVGVATTLAAAAAIAIAWTGSTAMAPESKGHAESSDVEVRAAAGAQYAQVEAGAWQTYRLTDGAVEFAIPPLPAGHRFAVVVGDDRVEVHGTRFTVVAEAGVLSEVQVESGIVAVHLSNGDEHRLEAGQHWRRTAHESRSASADPVTEPSETHELAMPVATRSEARQKARSFSIRSDEPDSDEPDSEQPDTTDGLDDAFAQAWQLRREGRYDAAAYAFDALLERGDLGARRADILFWSATAHVHAGRSAQARERLSQLLQRYPDAWRAGEAEQLLERLGSP